MTMIDRALERLSQALLAVGLLAGFLMMLHVTAEVIMRSVFNAPMSGTYETVAGYYMIAAAFLPWAWLARSDGHIAAEIFTERLSARTQRVLGIFTTLLTIGYMVLFTWQAWVSAERRTAQNEVLEIPTGFLTVWPARWLLPIAGAAMLAVLVLRLARDLRLVLRGGED